MKNAGFDWLTKNHKKTIHTSLLNSPQLPKQLLGVTESWALSLWDHLDLWLRTAMLRVQRPCAAAKAGRNCLDSKIYPTTTFAQQTPKLSSPSSENVQTLWVWYHYPKSYDVSHVDFARNIPRWCAVGCWLNFQRFHGLTTWPLDDHSWNGSFNILTHFNFTGVLGNISYYLLYCECTYPIFPKLLLLLVSWGK